MSNLNYAYEVDLRTETSAAKVVRLIGTHKRVLELGAGPGSVTRILKLANHCNVTAIEIDEDAIISLQHYATKVYSLDLNSSTWFEALEQETPFDVVLAGDVLEHLHHPQQTLAQISKLLHPNGYIVASIPHAGHYAVIACLLNEHFDYQDYGILDKTHIRFFGLKDIQHLFNKESLNIEEAEFVIRQPEYTELAAHWRKLSTPLKDALIEHKYGNIYQVIIKAKPASCSSINIDLMKLPIDTQESSYPRNASFLTLAFYKLKQCVLPYLSANHRKKIKYWLEKMHLRARL